MTDRGQDNLLRAILADDPGVAAKAYARWRSLTPLDDVDHITYQMMPLLLRTAQRTGQIDQDGPRMRGVAKHIWLSNLLRLRPLSVALGALAAAGIDALLLKGAALFARDNEVSALRLASDYDILIRRADATRGIAALRASGFKSEFGFVTQDFAAADFDALHAAHLALETEGTDEAASLDLHWRPLPQLRDPGIFDELWGRSEQAVISGAMAKIPSLADQLFLAVARPEPWDADEVLLRAAEATLLLRGCNGKLDWALFEALVVRHGYGWIAASMLHLVAGLGAPVQDGVVSRLWGRQAPLNALELAVRRTAPHHRGSLQRVMLEFIQRAKAEPTSSAAAAVRAMLGRPAVRRELSTVARRHMGLDRVDLPAVWAAQAAVPAASDTLNFVRGFSIPEQAGRWTEGNVAVLEMPVDAAADTILPVRLKVTAFIPPRRFRCRFEVAAGAGDVVRYAAWRHRGRGAEFTVPARVIGGAQPKVVLAIRVRDARPPVAFGLSDDFRLLGLMVEDVGLGDGRMSMDVSAPRPQFSGSQ